MDVLVHVHVQKVWGIPQNQVFLVLLTRSLTQSFSLEIRGNSLQDATSWDVVIDVSKHGVVAANRSSVVGILDAFRKEPGLVSRKQEIVVEIVDHPKLEIQILVHVGTKIDKKTIIAKFTYSVNHIAFPVG